MCFVPGDTTIYREMIEHLKEWWGAWTILLGIVALVLLFTLTATWGLPRVVSCINPHPGPSQPAVELHLSSNRDGGVIVGRRFLGCSWYFHEGRGPVD